MKSFEELEVWKESTKLRRMVANICKSLPEYENYLLKNQMIRASRSVTNNIAEGYGRYHYQENIQACRISRGSLHELLDDILIAKDEEYVNNHQYDETKELINKCLAILNGYINYLRRAKAETINEPDVDYEIN